MESAVCLSDPGAVSEVHGVRESSSKGDGVSSDQSSGSGVSSGKGSKESSGHGGVKHVTFAEPEGGSSSRGQTESQPDSGDSAHSSETGGENSGDSNPTEPASTDSAPRSGDLGSTSVDVMTINGNAGGEHASEVSDSTGDSMIVGGVAGDKGLLMQQLTSWCRHKQPWLLPKLEQCLLKAYHQCSIIVVRVSNLVKRGLTDG